MKTQARALPVVFGIFAFSCCLPAGMPFSLSTQKAGPELPASGIVVEDVKHNSEGEKAGLRAGDVVLAWDRGNLRKAIDSPFDLLWIEMNQRPLGPIHLEGLRGGKNQVWTLGPDEWGIQARPQWAERAPAVDPERGELDDSRKIIEAAERWQQAADEHDGSASPFFSGWLRFRAGELLADAGQWNEADHAYEQCIEKTNEAVISALALRARAKAFQKRSDWENANKYYQLAITESRKLGSEGELVVASALEELGTIAWKRRDPAKSNEYYGQALEIRAKLAPESLDVARSLNDLGSIAWYRGDLDTAEHDHQEALGMAQKLAPGGIDVAKNLNNLGNIAMMRGKLDKADEYYQESLRIRERLQPESIELASTLNNLGAVALRRGDFIKAEQYQRRSLEIKRKLAPGSILLVNTLNNLGLIAHDEGDPEKAEQYYRQALEIAQKQSPGSLEVAKTLDNLGLLARERGDLAKAEAYYQESLAIGEKVAPNELSLSVTFQNLGGIEEEQQNFAKAEEFYQEARGIAEKSAPGSVLVAEIEQSLGDVARKRGDMLKAEQCYRRALAIRQAFLPHTAELADSLAALAFVMSSHQQHAEASDLLAQAIDSLESQTVRVLSSESRSRFRAARLSYYYKYADLLLQLEQPERAFDVLERSRARNLLEILAEGRVNIRKGVDPAILDQKHSLEQLLASKSSERIDLLSRTHTSDQLLGLNQEIENLVAQKRELEHQIRLQSPGYAALTQPEPLRTVQIQQLLDPDTLLLEYALGEERSWLFVLSANTLTSYELAKEAEIEGAARRLYKLLTARNEVPKGETELQKQNRLLHVEREFAAASLSLSQMLLGPAAQQLEGKRLVIASDGTLNYIPFAVLPEPRASVAAKTMQPLIVDHELVNLPSASVLAILRSQAEDRKRKTKSVAVLADPVFSTEDERLLKTRPQRSTKTRLSQAVINGKDAEKPGLPPRLSRFVQDLGLDTSFQLDRLPFSRREANAILSVTPPGQGMAALDFRASRATALHPALSEYRIVHFATHGFLDNEHPELSGLVLSLVDENGRRQDGLVELQDIYNLDLPVDLVVLSACKTGLGKQIKGEGLVGLTRGFMHAGATRIVASLWEVDDAGTAELMKRFYKAMLQEGMRPAAALREAQVEMSKDKRWADPYYWAGFQIQGEWR
jgi:CHAT domain-containing protein